MGRLNFEHAVVLFVTAIGFVSAAHAISNNTMLLHLRTGLDIAANGSIPRHDPYSFTAYGHDWLVQSWFAEWTYGVLYQLTDTWRSVIFEQMVLCAAIALLIALIARTGSTAGTAVASVIALTIGLPDWSERPTLFGLFCFAALIYVVDRKKSWFWLLPIGWLWVNTHGSYPLGVLWVLFTFGGAFIDNRSRSKELLKPGVFFLGGLLLGAVNPLGPKILTFPFEVLSSRKEIFGNIVEWQSPDFHSAVGIVQLLAIAIGLAIMFCRPIKWRYVIPAIGFVALALYVTRNVQFAAIALLPAMREALTRVNQTKSSEVSPALIAALGVVLTLMVGNSVWKVVDSEPLKLDAYPVAAIDWMDGKGLLDTGHRVAAEDTTGCYRIFRDGTQKRVFIDDRYDMYPSDISSDYVGLLRSTEDPQAILSKHDIDVVLWKRDSPLTNFLHADVENWQQQYGDQDWVVFIKK